MGRLFLNNPFDSLDSISVVTEESVRRGMMIEKWNHLAQDHRPVGPVSNTWTEELVLLLKREYGLPKEAVHLKNGIYELQLRNFKLRVVKPAGDDGYAVPVLGKPYVNVIGGIAPSDAAALIKDFDCSCSEMQPEINRRFMELKREEEGKRKLRARRDILQPAIKSCQERFLSPEGINVEWTPQSDGKIKLTFRRVEECTVTVPTEELLALLSDGSKVREMLKENLRY